MTSVPKEAWIGLFYELMLLYNNVAKLRQKLDRRHHFLCAKAGLDWPAGSYCRCEMLAEKALKRRAVCEVDRSGRRARDQAGPLQLRDSSAHGLNRQTEMVGNVLMGHQEINVCRLSHSAGQVE